MKGLRVYIDQKKRGAWYGGTIFYSRRAGGPYYQWRYEELSGQWLGSRMHACDLMVSELVAAPWKWIPAELKTSLDEHYVD